MPKPPARPALEGTCLCKTVQLGVARAPRQLTQCNCSVCRRYGTLWAYYKRSAISIAAPRGALTNFSPIPNGLRFIHCTTCGCVIAWDSRRKAADRRAGVNMRLFDHARMSSVPIKVLDGDRTWRILGTYVKPEIWISPAHRG